MRALSIPRLATFVSLMLLLCCSFFFMFACAYCCVVCCCYSFFVVGVFDDSCEPFFWRAT